MCVASYQRRRVWCGCTVNHHLGTGVACLCGGFALGFFSIIPLDFQARIDIEPQLSLHFKHIDFWWKCV